MSCEGWKYMVAVVVINVVLSTLHFALKTIKAKTESKIDDDLDELIEKLLKVVEWIMAAGRR